MSQQVQQHPAGYVGHDSRGHFVHYCHCGKWAPFGYGARKGRLGEWFCGDHRREGPTPVIVTLSEIWLNKAIEAGKARQVYARRSNLRHYGKAQHDAAADDISGCIAEVAVAKHFRLPWKPNVGVIDAIDVGDKIEVRGRRVDSDGNKAGQDLQIRPKDKDHLPYVYAEVNADNTVRLVGWLYGQQGKGNDKYWNAACKCWWNPPPFRPISELMGIIRP